MKKLILLSLFFVSSLLKAQQWEWAVSADSVFGDQQAKMIVRNNTDLFALIFQSGSSVINGTHLDPGSVILKISSGGQILWVKQFGCEINAIYADDNGELYFIGNFTNSLNFTDTTIISHGLQDIFYGRLDPAGNMIQLSSAGGIQNDFGRGIITDGGGNLFLAGFIKGNFYNGSQYISGNDGYGTYFLRCGLNGNLIETHRDTIADYQIYNYGENFQKDNTGSIYMSNQYIEHDCNYVCSAFNILKLNPTDYTFNEVARFSTFEYLHSWFVNDDFTVSSNYNTGSHYLTSYVLFNSTPTQDTHRKEMGDGYDGKITPCISHSLNSNLLVSGMFYNCFRYGGSDTIHYDSFSLVADSLPNVMIGEINPSNQYNWVLRSDGRGAGVTSMTSDNVGRCYITGDYNLQDYYITDSINPITFGNVTLESENKFHRFYVAGASGPAVAGLTKNKKTDRINIYPNPAATELKIRSEEPKIITVKLYRTNGILIIEENAASGSISIDVSSILPGMYIIEALNDNEIYREKIIISR